MKVPNLPPIDNGVVPKNSITGDATRHATRRSTSIKSHEPQENQGFGCDSGKKPESIIKISDSDTTLTIFASDTKGQGSPKIPPETAEILKKWAKKGRKGQGKFAIEWAAAQVLKNCLKDAKDRLCPRQYSA